MHCGFYTLFTEIDQEAAHKLNEFVLKFNLFTDKNTPITLIINSEGGSVIDGMSIIDFIESSATSVRTMCTGTCASMASLIFASGTKGQRMMTQNSFLMTHQMYAGQFGSMSELRAARKFDDLLYDKIIKHYVKCSKLNEQEVHDLLLNSTDTWLTAEQAIEYGLCDKIITNFQSLS